MSQTPPQYAFRAQKSLGLMAGFAPVAGFSDPGVPARMYTYSADGRLYAYAVGTVLRIFQAESAQLIQELNLPNIVELKFSPRGTYISTWERSVKLDDGTQHKNLRVFSVSTGEELISFSQKSLEGWDLQYTISESHAIRLVSGEIQVFRPAEWSGGIVDKLRVEGATSVQLSPGLNPSVAVFVGEKKGAPASVKIYGLLTLNSPPTCMKTFYKADRCQIKWNTLGTQVLVLTHTDVDNSNKSYYGETAMYLLSAAGNFDCRVTLDKEGPIHDFSWSPNSKEFGVVYGFMPAKTVIFDQRVRTLHDFGAAPQNFISFNPQGRLVALAGFGNLAGKIDIYDRRTLAKVTSIDAPNTSYCEWSPDGRYLLTGTLSPRLRVDNGIKIWHCTGPLVHVQEIEELYQTSWRPALVENSPPFPIVLPPAPEKSEIVKEWEAKKGPKAVVAAKPAGAYRPPGARGLATPSIFKREDEGGVAIKSAPGSGSNSPARGYNRSPAPPGQQQNGKRSVPGAPPPNSNGNANGNSTSVDDQKKRKRNKGGKNKDGPTTTPPTQSQDGTPRSSIDIRVNVNGGGKVNGKLNAEIIIPPSMPDVDIVSPVTPGVDSALDPVAKKVRNLSKKLKAIEELKDKAKRGERLEATQLKKMDGEAEIRKELIALGGA